MWGDTPHAPFPQVVGGEDVGGYPPRPLSPSGGRGGCGGYLPSSFSQVVLEDTLHAPHCSVYCTAKEGGVNATHARASSRTRARKRRHASKAVIGEVIRNAAQTAGNPPPKNVRKIQTSSTAAHMPPEPMISG
jgi:hypothetical protein